MTSFPFTIINAFIIQRADIITSLCMLHKYTESLLQSPESLQFTLYSPRDTTLFPDYLIFCASSDQRNHVSSSQITLYSQTVSFSFPHGT